MARSRIVGGDPAAAAASPRPFVDLSACWEVVGRYWMVGSVGLMVLMIVLVTVQHAESQSLQAARLLITLEEVRGRLEAELAIGFELGDSSSASTAALRPRAACCSLPKSEKQR